MIRSHLAYAHDALYDDGLVTSSDTTRSEEPKAGDLDQETLYEVLLRTRTTDYSDSISM